MEALDTAAAANGREWIERLARLGYAAKGLVYILIGLMAVQVAMGQPGQTSGPQGALAAIAAQPFGEFLLIATAVGLFGYAFWRFVEAAVDPQQNGTDGKGLATRCGYVCSGIVYGSLGVEAVRIATGGGGGGGESGAQHWTGRLMQQPFGPALVGMVGVAIVGVGLFQLRKAWTADFQKLLKFHEMSATEIRWSTRIGRAGFAARGIVYLIIGGGLLSAAMNSNPSEAIGFGQALRSLSQQSYGPWLLGVVAVGLSAYGVFSAAILARYRRILGAS